MQSLFLKINADEIGAWRAHRIFVACRHFVKTIDPTSCGQAVYEDHQRVGWTFFASSAASRDRLATFHAQLTGLVLDEQELGHPADRGSYDAAAALYQG